MGCYVMRFRVQNYTIVILRLLQLLYHAVQRPYMAGIPVLTTLVLKPLARQCRVVCTSCAPGHAILRETECVPDATIESNAKGRSKRKENCATFGGAPVSTKRPPQYAPSRYYKTETARVPQRSKKCTYYYTPESLILRPAVLK
jgi:hypothetical protein